MSRFYTYANAPLGGPLNARGGNSMAVERRGGGMADGHRHGDMISYDGSYEPLYGDYNQGGYGQGGLQPGRLQSSRLLSRRLRWPRWL